MLPNGAFNVTHLAVHVGTPDALLHSILGRCRQHGLGGAQDLHGQLPRWRYNHGLHAAQQLAVVACKLGGPSLPKDADLARGAMLWAHWLTQAWMARACELGARMVPQRLAPHTALLRRPGWCLMMLHAAAWVARLPMKLGSYKQVELTWDASVLARWMAMCKIGSRYARVCSISIMLLPWGGVRAA